MEWLSLAAGVVCLGILFIDVFSTVFISGGEAGYVTSRLYRVVWGLWKRLAEAAPAHRRRRLLALGGPLLLPLTVGLWIGELIVGFALIYVPLLDDLALPPASEDEVTWLTVLYYSGYCAATLGIGDVIPTTAELRLLGVVEAVLGFSLFSASITYLLSVYGALTTTTSLAREIAHFLGLERGQDALSALIAIHRAHATEQLTGWLGQVIGTMQRVVRGHGNYPLLHYFHIAEDESALPVVLPELLEMLTIVRAMLDPAVYPAFVEGPAVVAAYDSGTGLERARLAALAIPCRDERGGAADREALAVRARLADAGIAVRDESESCARYEQLRSRWHGANSALRDHYGYR